MVALLGERQCWRIFIKSSISTGRDGSKAEARIPLPLNWSFKADQRGELVKNRPSPSCSLFRMYIGGELAAVAEAEAEPAKQRAAATADGALANVRGAGAMASTTFLAEVRLRFLFELEPDRADHQIE